MLGSVEHSDPPDLRRRQQRTFRSFPFAAFPRRSRGSCAQLEDAGPQIRTGSGEQLTARCRRTATRPSRGMCRRTCRSSQPSKRATRVKQARRCAATMRSSTGRTTTTCSRGASTTCLEHASVLASGGLNVSEGHDVDRVSKKCFDSPLASGPNQPSEAQKLSHRAHAPASASQTLQHRPPAHHWSSTYSSPTSANSHSRSSASSILDSMTSRCRRRFAI